MIDQVDSYGPVNRPDAKVVIAEILTPTRLVINGVPKEYDQYFDSDHLVFFALPKVYTMTEFDELFAGRQGEENIRPLVESSTPFIIGVKRNSAMVHIYDPRQNTAAGCVITSTDPNKEAALYDWSNRKIHFSHPMSRDRFTPLAQVLNQLKLPSTLKKDILTKQEYWSDIYTYLTDPTPENIERLRLLFAGKEFGLNKYYGNNRLMVVTNATRQGNNLFVDLIGSTDEQSGGFLSVVPTGRLPEIPAIRESPRILRTIDTFLSSPDNLRSVTDKIRKFNPAVTEAGVVEWMSRFRLGIEYVYKTYGGVVANNIYIAESIIWNNISNDDMVTYIPDPETDAIVITHKFLGRSIGAMQSGIRTTNPNISPNLDMWVEGKDFPILLGVEEAHHSYFLKSGNGRPDPTPGKYTTDPVELAAGVAVQQAIIDFNITTFSSSRAFETI